MHALPNASFVDFSGTPVKLLSTNTHEIFGQNIYRYDIAQASEDKALLPYYYESRFIPLDLTGGDINEEYKQVMQDIGSLKDEMIDPLLFDPLLLKI